ncbi:hypothetical protein [Parasphaerochaeta coccoides]|uniref:hypothetical protein n=1 Tax=Parasphaerochaeta coccoides TaxID=273376 RepID=UPI0002FBFABE|nr:hypothetical protein [Parasphaerochaeta coccoides]
MSRNLSLRILEIIVTGLDSTLEKLIISLEGRTDSMGESETVCIRKESGKCTYGTM